VLGSNVVMGGLIGNSREKAQKTQKRGKRNDDTAFLQCPVCFPIFLCFLCLFAAIHFCTFVAGL
jgi:hypothetical protein